MVVANRLAYFGGRVLPYYLWLGSLTSDGTCVPCSGSNHWTAREFPVAHS